jgi:hypothetical protein
VLAKAQSTQVKVNQRAKDVAVEWSIKISKEQS